MTPPLSIPAASEGPLTPKARLARAAEVAKKTAADLAQMQAVREAASHHHRN